jgi:hypothetical protein
MSESDLPFRVYIIDCATTQEDFGCIFEQDKIVIQPVAYALRDSHI